MKKVISRSVFIGVSFLLLTWCLCQAVYADPVISVAPMSVNMGNIPVGVTSAPKTVTISNKGTSDLSLDPITIKDTTGEDTTEFSIQSNTCSTIPAKGSCAITVVFTPKISFGKKNAVMSIASDDPKKPTVSVKLSGQAPPPKISASPMSVNFGSVPLGSSSIAKTVTVKNTGVSDLIIDPVSIKDKTGEDTTEFSIQSNTCSTIPAKGSCAITAVFTPKISFGKKDAVLIIASNDPKKLTLNVKLSGQAPPPKISASPMSVNFGSLAVGATSSPKTVTVKNTGISELTINAITITGDSESEFSRAHDCSELAKGGACSISVTFNPSTAGKKTALVNIETNDPQKPYVSVKLSGTVPGSAPVPPPDVQKAKNLVADLRNTVLSIYNYEGVGVTGIFNTPFLNLSNEINTKIEPELINTVQRIQWIIDSASYVNPGDTKNFIFYQDSIKHTLTITLSSDSTHANFTITNGSGNQTDSGQLTIDDPHQPTTGSFNASMETANGTLVASLNYAATVSNGSYATMSFTGSLIAPGLSIDFSQSGRSLSGKFARVPGSTDPSDIYPTDIYLSGQIQTATTELDGTLHVSSIVWNAISNQFFPEDASFEGSFNELQNGIPTGVIFTGNLSGSWNNAKTFNTEIDESPSNFPRWDASFDGEIEAPSRPRITASLGVSQTSYNTLSLTIGYTRRNIDGTEIYLRGNGSYHLDIELLTANLVNQDGMKVFFSVGGNKSGDGSFTGQITAAGGGKVADLYTISGVPMVKYIDGYIESVF